MRIAIASGKGGTGKTTVSASLAHVWDQPLTAVDLDVEEPNLHLFLKPMIEGTEIANMEVPAVDESLCNHCRECSSICQFAAISVLGDVVISFPEMCHGCGGCMAVCPTGAITSGERILGDVSWGSAGRHRFLMGRLRVGEAMSPPLMRQVKAKLNSWAPDGDAVIDAPPGVSCPAVNAVMDTDAIVLVTEPTPFGHYDLKLAHEAFKPIGLPMGVVINRAGLGDDSVYRFCRESGLPLLAQIPYDRHIAEQYSQGKIVAEISPELTAIFKSLAERIRRLAAGNFGEA